MPNNHKGYVFKDRKTGKWFARVTVTDNNGKRRNIKKTANGGKGSASKLLKVMISDLEDRGAEAIIETDRITFRDLAEKYAEFKVKPAEYRGDRKIAGLRSSRTVKYRVSALLDYFGKMKLHSITLGEIERFKAKRLNTKTKSGKERSVAAVNRELEVLRAMLRYARNEGWIEYSPFERASTPLISKADETKRDRILSREEERLLLAACADPVREHLRPLIIAAVDTGMRKGELLSLTWKDVDFASRVINVRALTTKTLSARVLPISERLFSELTRLYARFPDRPLVFGVTTKFQHSWETACRIAGLDDLRYHDLRATFCTRLIEAGMPIEQVAKLSGHTQLSTLYAHYLGTTNQALARAADILNQMHSGGGGKDILDGDNSAGYVN